MTHCERILKILGDLPTRGRERGSLSRAQLEGYAKTPSEKRAASALIDYMLAAGDLVPVGGPRNRTYTLPRRK